MRAAIVRLRDTCAVTDLVLGDALAAMEAQPPDHREAASCIATARIILREGSASSKPGRAIEPPPLLASSPSTAG